MVAMVGLPARGKSYLSNKLQRYLLVSLRFERFRPTSIDTCFSQWLEYEVGPCR